MIYELLMAAFGTIVISVGGGPASLRLGIAAILWAMFCGIYEIHQCLKS